MISEKAVLGFPDIKTIRTRLSDPYFDIADVFNVFSEIPDSVTYGRGTIIYPDCIIYPNVTIGDDCTLFHRVIVRENVTIGNRVKLGFNSAIERNAEISDDVRIMDYTKIGDFCKVGARSFIGNNVTFSCDKYPPSNIVSPIVIGADVHIAPGCILGPGVKIDNNAFVGLGSLVLKDLAGGFVYFGHPVKEPYCTIGEYRKKRQNFLEDLPLEDVITT